MTLSYKYKHYIFSKDPSYMYILTMSYNLCNICIHSTTKFKLITLLCTHIHSYMLWKVHPHDSCKKTKRDKPPLPPKKRKKKEQKLHRSFASYQQSWHKVSITLVDTPHHVQMNINHSWNFQVEEIQKQSSKVYFDHYQTLEFL